VTGLNGNALSADVVDSAGDRLYMTLVVSIDTTTNVVHGNLNASVSSGTEQQ
jgi:hypothetical protein